MVLVCLEVSCSPTGEDKYPVPTTIRIARIFADAKDVAENFPSDKIIEADSAYVGQNVYYICWNTDEPLNIDRSTETDNVISNCGMWLPAASRVFGDVCGLEMELVAPARLAERQRKRAAAQRVADAGEDKKGAGGKRSGGEAADGEYAEALASPVVATHTNPCTSRFVSSRGAPWRNRW